MEDYSSLTGKDFEFLITHSENFEISNDVFDSLMTPNTIEWIKVLKHDWAYYQVLPDFRRLKLFCRNDNQSDNQAENIQINVVNQLIASRLKRLF